MAEVRVTIDVRRALCALAMAAATTACGGDDDHDDQGTSSGTPAGADGSVSDGSSPGTDGGSPDGSSPIDAGDAGDGGDGGAGSLSISPTTNDYGNRTIGTQSPTVDFAVTNAGPGASGSMTVALGGLHPSSWQIAADACNGKVIAAGASCVVKVSFAPEQQGTLSADLVVRAGGKTAKSTLAGKGIGLARLVLSPDRFDFGATPSSTALEKVFTLTNAGDLPSTPPTFAIGGDTSAFQVFYDGTFTCNAGLAAGASCQVKAIFTPPNAGAKAGTLEVSATNGGHTLVPLTGLAKIPADVHASPTSFTFPPTEVGATGTKKAFTFKNHGEWPTPVLVASLTGANAGDYEKVTDTCNAALAAGATCTVEVSPKPGSLGGKVATLQVGNVGPAYVSLGYNAIAVPSIVLSPSTRHFGSVIDGQPSTTETFTVTNPAATATGMLTVALSGTNQSEFSIQSNGCTTLAAGASCNIGVRFTPAGTGPRLAFLQVNGAGTAQSSLTGSGVSAAALQFDLTGINFGSRKIRSTSTSVIATLKNTGMIATSAIATSLTGAGASSFTIASDGCSGAVLAQNATCTVALKFAPTTSGEKAAELTASAATGGASIVSLAGTSDDTWTLGATTTGSGSGSVIGTGIDCPADCGESYVDGSVVALTAVPDSATSVFTGWSGACTGNGACNVTMDQFRTVTANFVPASFNLTVTKTGSNGAGGSVASAPAGIDCGATCTAPFVFGTSVTLVATPNAGDAFERWSGACTGTEPTCTVSVTEARGVTAYFAKLNKVFVTSTKHVAGAIGSVANADAICQARATAAGLAGTYKAWLSSSTTSALEHVSGSAPPRGFVRTDGKPFADSLADLTIGRVMHPISRDENGNAVIESNVITGTYSDGTAGPNLTCSDWTSTAAGTWPISGLTTAGTQEWTHWIWAGRTWGLLPVCSDEGRLYCFGTDYHAALPRPAIPGRRAFVTDAPWFDTNGLAGADQLCTTEATAAGYPGTYKAFLATNTTTAISRVSTNGTPWYRPDGVQIVATAADLATGNLLAPMNVTPTFVYRSHQTAVFDPVRSFPYVWTGAKGPAAVGTNLTCNDWTSTSLANDGQLGKITVATTEALGDTVNVAPCGVFAVPIYCLQE